MGRRGHIVALCAALGLMGCFDKLPEPLACAEITDCLAGESCVGGVCVRAMVAEDMDAPDMNMSDMNTPDISMPDMSMSDMNVPDMSVPDMNVAMTKDVVFFVNDASSQNPGTPVNYARIVICLAGGKQYIHRDIITPEKPSVTFKLSNNTRYDLFAAKAHDSQPYYAQDSQLNKDGIDLNLNYTFYLNSCEGEGVICNEGALSECYKSAFGGPYYEAP